MTMSLMRTRVKICGLRQADDVVAAVRMGADALGFVFYTPSPRAIDANIAANLIKTVPSFVTRVGLFVNATSADIEQVLAKAPMQLLQFHGDESPEFCRQFQLPYIKAVRMKPDTDLHYIRNSYATAQGLLLDAYQAGTPGGTGTAFNWHLIPQDMRSDIILAGGLDEHNIVTAIDTIRPWAVDVSGGVEMKTEKGKKDHARMRGFMKAVYSTY